MINISLQDLMVGIDRPASRTASRSETRDFAVLLDHGALKQDAGELLTERGRVADARDVRDETRPTGGFERREGEPLAERLARATTDTARTRATESATDQAASLEAQSPTDGATAELGGTVTDTRQESTEPDSAVATGGSSAQSAGTQISPTAPAVPLTPDAVAAIAPVALSVAAASANGASPNGAAQAVASGTPATQRSPAPVPAGTGLVEGATDSATLFAASLLAQHDAALTATPLAQDAATQPVPSPTSFKPPAAISFPGAAPSDPSATQVAGRPVVPAEVTHAATPVARQAAQLGSLLDLQDVTLEISHAGAAVGTKPLPALANGMVAQFGLAPQMDRPTTPATPSASTLGGVGDATAAAGGTPTQTAAAVAAAPAAQSMADEPQAKFTPPEDGMALQAPAPAAFAAAGRTAAVDHAAPAKFTVPTPSATDQVAVHVAKAASESLDKINIKLKPASLGQIEVQLDVAPDGRIHAVIAADKPETLDLLQRDARALERALNDAGLRADSGSLSFNLRGQNQQFGDMPGNPGSAGRWGAAAERTPDMGLLSATSRIGAYLNARAAAGGVDIQV